MSEKPKRGDFVTDCMSKITVMAVADNYVMYRRPGCMPSVKPINKWNELKTLGDNLKTILVTDSGLKEGYRNEVD